MTRYLLTYLLLALALESFAQRNGGAVNWGDYRHEIEFGVGASNYLGELGGNGESASRYSPTDVEVTETKYAFTLGYRYNFGPYFSLNPSFYVGKVSGNDKLTSEATRNYRNLAFHSQIYELAIKAEGHLLRPTYGRGYYRKGVIGKRGQKFALSGHLGIGFFYFNPKYGTVNLRELSTEGQGLDGGPKQYSRIAISFPMGFKVGYRISKAFRIGIDMTYRYTTTDYLDDVSGEYYDKEKIRAAKGDLAAEMSNRSNGNNPTWTSEGAPRGNPNSRDSFFTGEIILTYSPFLHTTNVGKKRNRARF